MLPRGLQLVERSAPDLGCRVRASAVSVSKTISECPHIHHDCRAAAENPPEHVVPIRAPLAPENADLATELGVGAKTVSYQSSGDKLAATPGRDGERHAAPER